MDLINDFLRDKSRARLAMVGAIVLNFASQFFYYFNDPGSAMLTNMTDTSRYTGIIYFGGAGVATGWEIHPHAYVLLVALAFAFLRDDIVDIGWFRKWGWWLAAVAVFACTQPGNYVNEAGGIMGGLSILLAIAAAVLHRREERAAGAAPAASVRNRRKPKARSG